MATLEGKRELKETKLQYDPEGRQQLIGISGQNSTYQALRKEMDILLYPKNFESVDNLHSSYNSCLEKLRAEDVNRYPRFGGLNFFCNYVDSFIHHYYHLSDEAKQYHRNNIKKMLEKGANPFLPYFSRRTNLEVSLEEEDSIVGMVLGYYDPLSVYNQGLSEPQRQDKPADEILKIMCECVNPQQLLDSIKEGPKKKILSDRMRGLVSGTETERRQPEGKEREVKQRISLPTPEDKFSPSLQKASEYLSQFTDVSGVQEVVELIKQAQQIEQYEFALMPENGQPEKKAGVIYLKCDLSHLVHEAQKDLIEYVVVASDGKEKKGSISWEDLGLEREQITPFSIGKLEELKLTTFLKDKISVDSCDLRGRVKALDDQAVKTNHSDLSAVTHYTLLALAVKNPRNYQDIYTADVIPSDVLIHTSSGHRFNIHTLLQDHNGRSYQGSKGEQYRSKWLLNPYVGSQFDFRDVTLIEALAVTKGLEIENLRGRDVEAKAASRYYTRRGQDDLQALRDRLREDLFGGVWADWPQPGDVDAEEFVAPEHGVGAHWFPAENVGADAAVAILAEGAVPPAHIGFFSGPSGTRHKGLTVSAAVGIIGTLALGLVDYFDPEAMNYSAKGVDNNMAEFGMSCFAGLTVSLLCILIYAYIRHRRELRVVAVPAELWVAPGALMA